MRKERYEKGKEEERDKSANERKYDRTTRESIVKRYKRVTATEGGEMRGKEKKEGEKGGKEEKD